ncbi:MAG: LicD family protein [Bilifractor sp.]|nr:LicD family protein [Bilifractor sp.]
MAKDNRNLFKTGFSKDDLVILDDEKLHRMQETTLGILRDFVDVADRYHLNYCMGGGSCLGAVRHHGFIPWDDDVDINIPRRDYERLMEIFDRELGDRYCLNTPEKTHDHGQSNATITKKGTAYRSFNELSKDNPGIGIDLFVIENTYDNPVLRKLQGIFSLGAGYILTCRKTTHDMPFLEPYLKDAPEVAAAFRKKDRFGRFFRWMSLDKVTRMTAHQYGICRNNHSKYVTVPSGRKHFFGEMYPRDVLCETVQMPFEDIEVRVARDYDTYMRGLYGDDYMVIPPEGKHEQHAIMELDFGDDADAAAGLAGIEAKGAAARDPDRSTAKGAAAGETEGSGDKAASKDEETASGR